MATLWGFIAPNVACCMGLGAKNGNFVPKGHYLVGVGFVSGLFCS